MAAWRRCENCRKVKSDSEFDGDAATCTACLNAPVKVARAPRAGSVKTRHVAPAEGAAPVAPPADPASTTPPARPARTGVVGRGDPEVRSRRARTKAMSELVEMHADDFDRLLLDARKAEGLT